MKDKQVAKWCAAVSVLLIVFTIYRNYTQDKRKATFILSHQCTRVDTYRDNPWYQCDNGLWEEKDIDLFIKN
jgi:hypothetical protein